MKKAFNSVFKNKLSTEKVKDEDQGTNLDKGESRSSLSIGGNSSGALKNLPPIATSKNKSTSSTTLQTNMDNSINSSKVINSKQGKTLSTTSSALSSATSTTGSHQSISNKSSSKQIQSEPSQPIVTSPSSDGEVTNNLHYNNCVNNNSPSVHLNNNSSESDKSSVKFEKHLTSSSAAKSKFMSTESGLVAEKKIANLQESRRLQSTDRSYEERIAAKDVSAKLESPLEGIKASSKLSSYRQDARAIKLTDSSITSQQSSSKSSAFKMSTEELSTGGKSKASFESQSSIRTEEKNVKTSKTSSSTSSTRYFATKSSSSTIKSSITGARGSIGGDNGSISSESPIITEPLSPSEISFNSPFDMDFSMLSLTSSGTDRFSEPSTAETMAFNNLIGRIASKFKSLVESLKNCAKEESVELLKSLNRAMEKAMVNRISQEKLFLQLSDLLRTSGGLDVIIENCGLHEIDSEVKFQSAKLLEQTLSPDNRAYVVDNGLSKVVSLACQYSNTNVIDQERVGTGILNQLLQISEETCKDIIRKGGLKAIVYQCRNTDDETLRHCASALANLSLYGGPENHASMIKEQAPMWLFPLAHHTDDNIAYYACLAIATLVANKEIEASVLSSGTHELIEPFITDRSPEEFATHSNCHSRGQSKEWLKRLALVLESDREEARSLAAFHFAMEAWIKKRRGETKIFEDIGVIDRLMRVASSPNATASKYACQALKFMGKSVPHKLSQQVPLWTVADVLEWLKQIGFGEWMLAFKNSRVDGDLLLQLTEDMLRYDLKMENGILRRRFIRELGHLKRIADYSSCDTLNLFHLLSSLGQVYPQYTYNMLKGGIEIETVKFLNDDLLLKECFIENAIHRYKIAEALKNLSNVGTCDSHDSKKSLDAFISYRRSNGSQLASLLKVHLQLKDFSVFIDIERLEAGKFDCNLLNSIKQAKNFILVLTPNALDRCLNDDECKDWVHKEIQEALASKCNIIPIMDNFQWPDPENLPEDIRAICYFNGVRWIHEYQEACVDKLERFMRGEINSRIDSSHPKNLPHHGVPGTPGTPIKPHGYPRAGSIDGLRSPPEVSKLIEKG
ncbi:sterile alpha and TIR motif-containing protein 1 isoform X2 [Tetranychus urticae]|uniref:sterile alpha and TIR motif-containing protein 1 isoform X2 n=1 Tax=Tetranychus urticae TaxID=32264 RepID=UPI000D64491B|nr:sterile alpha and TIR motif-containing protein 1 isoform X2 [Tetranychus urticae]